MIYLLVFMVLKEEDWINFVIIEKLIPWKSVLLGFIWKMQFDLQSIKRMLQKDLNTN